MFNKNKETSEYNNTNKNITSTKCLRYRGILNVNANQKYKIGDIVKTECVASPFMNTLYRMLKVSQSFEKYCKCHCQG
jgi:hypothetical protein